MSKKVKIEDFDEDYAKKQADAMLGALRLFCTSIDGKYDPKLFQHVRTSGRVLGSDGASKEVKTLRVLLTEVFPNAVLQARDIAHAVRIAFREPLLAETQFKLFWESLFDGEHALIKDIQYSDKLRAKLEACQRRVLRVKGAQGGNLDRVLRHFSWAKQRFESFAGPQRKVCCLIVAICILLASIAGDVREKSAKRERADALLEGMTPEFLVTAGLTADYTAECMDFFTHI